MSVRADLAQMEREIDDLFLNLNDLSNKSEAFYSVDRVLPEDGKTYRIFLYRLASYSDWLHPSALESRGAMFREDEPGKWVLVSRPMEKFFNWGEVSSDVNTLAQALIAQGRLSQDVWDRAKKRNSTEAA